MASQVVHDDNVTGLQCRNEYLVDIGAETFAIDGAIKYTRRGQLIAAQGGEKRHGIPMAVGSEASQPLSLHGPTSLWCHIGFDPCFVDEHETARVEAVHEAFPSTPLAGNIRPGLFNPEQRFF